MHFFPCSSPLSLSLQHAEGIQGSHDGQNTQPIIYSIMYFYTWDFPHLSNIDSV